MGKRVTLDDDELELIILWLKQVGSPMSLDTHYYTKKWSELATKRLLAKLVPLSEEGKRVRRNNGLL